jgi:aryl-alcohol dehydrogenase-like predicted oxidoreductase
MSQERYQPWLFKAPWDTIEALEEYATKRGLSLLDVAIGGLAARVGVVSVIAGATTPEQVRQNAAAGSWRPSAEDRLALDELLVHPV